jgi:hypothetical protein
MSNLAFITKPMTAAEKRNSRFNTNTSVFVSVKKRFDDYCTQVPGAATRMNNAIKVFKEKFPNLTWEQIESQLVEAKNCKLSDIQIDDTMNRPLDWEHVQKIVKNFCPTRIMPINVYKDANADGKSIAWDGQHTSVTLYVIGVLIFGKAIGNIMVPINISKATSKDEIRINFIELNGDAKLPLSPLDLFEQKVFGHLIDKSDRPDWELAANKFKAVSAVDMFLTSETYKDQDGAITHVASIINSDLDVVQQFSTYWKYRSQFENRRVESKELIHMIYLFNYAKSMGIDWSESDIESIVDIFWNCFACEFTGTQHINVFWKKLANSYDIWYDKVYSKVDEEYRPTKFKMTTSGVHQETFGLKFMLSQLSLSGFTGQLPDYEHPAGYKPRDLDLWEYSIDKTNELK